MIKENKVVRLNYKLRENNDKGTLIESTYEGEPLQFIFGQSSMMPSFEENINEKKEGDKFSFSIAAEDAYGDKNSDAIVDLDLNMFKIDGEVDFEVIKVGNTVPMQDSNGRRMDGVVLELNDSKVKMDFNHPLAGKNLHFEGEIVAVREATEEELATSEKGHCGGGCGSGEGGCCGGDEHSHDSEKEDGCCGGGCC